MIRFSVLALAAAVALAGAPVPLQGPPSAPRYHIVAKSAVGPAGCDFLAIDTRNRRLYGIGNYVVDIDGLTVIGRLSDSTARGGFVVAPELGRGVVRNGTIFDLKTGQTVAKVRARGDASVYDSVSQHAFLFGDPTYVIDVQTARLTATLSLGALLESGVADGRGHVYVNLADHDSVAEIDTHSDRVTHRWSVAPCKGPMGLAMDRASRRLFASCEMKSGAGEAHGAIAVLNADNGAVVSVVTLAGGITDQLAFDEGTKLLFSPSLDDTMSVLHEDTPDAYTVVQKLRAPELQSHKVVVDERSHRIFLPYADTTTESLGIVVLGPDAP